MTDDLVKQLRDRDHVGTPTEERNLVTSAADRIEQLAATNEELEAQIKDWRNDNTLAWNTCEEYRLLLKNMETLWAATKQDAVEAEVYAGELEEDLNNQKHLIEQLFSLLDIVEETDEGRTFRPNVIRSCRAADGEKLNDILVKLKSTVEKK